MDNILDHYKNPRHYGQLDKFTVKHGEANTLCGDKIEITIFLDDKEILRDAKFTGNGCAISQAAISMLLDEVIGMKKEEIMKINKDNMVEILGIELGPVRLKCGLLGLMTLHQALLK